MGTLPADPESAGRVFFCMSNLSDLFNKKSK